MTLPGKSDLWALWFSLQDLLMFLYVQYLDGKMIMVSSQQTQFAFMRKDKEQWQMMALDTECLGEGPHSLYLRDSGQVTHVGLLYSNKGMGGQIQTSWRPLSSSNILQFCLIRCHLLDHTMDRSSAMLSEIHVDIALMSQESSWQTVTSQAYFWLSEPGFG